MRTILAIVCAVVIVASGPAPAAAGRAELAGQRIQEVFSKLRDIARAGGIGGKLSIPEQNRDEVVQALERVSAAAVRTLFDEELPEFARYKKLFLVALELAERVARAGVAGRALPEGGHRYADEFFAGIAELRRVTQQQPDHAPPELADFQPALKRLSEVVKVRVSDEEFRRFDALVQRIQGFFAQE